MTPARAAKLRLADAKARAALGEPLAVYCAPLKPSWLQTPAEWDAVQVVFTALNLGAADADPGEVLSPWKACHHWGCPDRCTYDVPARRAA
jgi:hypothetical protein